jgi:hypothetical protein
MEPNPRPESDDTRKYVFFERYVDSNPKKIDTSSSSLLIWILYFYFFGELPYIYIVYTIHTMRVVG